MSSLTPLGSHLIVRPTPPDTASAGGSVFPDVHEERSAQSGTVVSVGQGPASAHKIRQAVIRSCRGRVAQALDGEPLSVLAAADRVLAAYAQEATALSEIEVGDFVAFPFTAGTVMEVNGETLLVMDEKDVSGYWRAPKE